jgi:hypothetical protein
VRYHRPSTFIAVFATAAVSLIVAACGGSSPHGTTSASNSSGRPTQAQAQHDAVRFADCMRSNGASNFPDPTTSPRAFKGAVNAKSPAVVSAERTCGRLLPEFGRSSQSEVRTHAQIAAMLAFARCIRSHGFGTFPDPTSTGDVTHQMIATAGIDLHQPAVLQAADTCVSVTHGLLTRAAVARFIEGH